MNEGEKNSKYVVKEEVIPSSMNMKKMEEMIKQLATQISQEQISQLEKRVEKIEERKEKIAFKASKWKMNLGKIVGTTLLTFHFFRLSIPHLILMFPIVLMKIDIQKRYNEDGSRNKAMSYIQIFSSLGLAMIDITCKETFGFNFCICCAICSSSFFHSNCSGIMLCFICFCISH